MVHYGAINQGCWSPCEASSLVSTQSSLGGDNGAIVDDALASGSPSTPAAACAGVSAPRDASASPSGEQQHQQYQEQQKQQQQRSADDALAAALQHLLAEEDETHVAVRRDNAGEDSG